MNARISSTACPLTGFLGTFQSSQKGLLKFLFPIGQKQVQRRLAFSLFPGLPQTDIDANQFRQAVINLVINASEACEAGGVIKISSSLVEIEKTGPWGTSLPLEVKAGKYICLEGADIGHGMDAETKAKIFDPFFSSKFVERGLGLAAVLRIVRGHKCSIDVLSEG